MIKVLIADDHEILRVGLKKIISKTTGITVVDEAASGQEVMDKVGKHELDVLLLDISMPGKSGIEILNDLKNFYPKLKILILTVHPEEQYAIRVLKAGASGYLNKDSAPDELITAIRKVAHGGKYIGESLAEKLVQHIEFDEEKPAHESLSNREFQVMRLIGSGKKLKEIASDLCLSINTISTYRSRIFEKMNLNTDAEIIRYAIKNGLVE